MNKKLLFLISGIILLMISCKKENSVPEVHVTFSIHQPTEGDTIAKYDSLFIAGTISGDGDLHGYQISLVNDVTGATFESFSHDDHANSYSINHFWINSVTSLTKMRVVLAVKKGHDGTLENFTKRVVFEP